ncbi:hypothetical protein CF335_g9361 [Tilletia laevis]|nr:hypothetical protein CF335_g9361 [Tilletia laevis]
MRSRKGCPELLAGRQTVPGSTVGRQAEPLQALPLQLPPPPLRSRGLSFIRVQRDFAFHELRKRAITKLRLACEEAGPYQNNDDDGECEWEWDS